MSNLSRLVELFGDLDHVSSRASIKRSASARGTTELQEVERLRSAITSKTMSANGFLSRGRPTTEAAEPGSVSRSEQALIIGVTALLSGKPKAKVLEAWVKRKSGLSGLPLKPAERFAGAKKLKDRLARPPAAEREAIKRQAQALAKISPADLVALAGPFVSKGATINDIFEAFDQPSSSAAE